MLFSNPIIPGFAPDPSVVYVDGIFYLATSSFHVFPGIPIYASINLRDWTLIGHAINRPEQLSLRHASSVSVSQPQHHDLIATGGLFAPTIRHHRGTFYVVCTNASLVPTIKVDNFLISTTNIWFSDWSNPLPVPFPGIDPSLFFDDDDRVYVQGSFSLGRGRVQPACTIKQFEIDISSGKSLGEARELWSGHSHVDTEAPHIYKVHGWYYLLVAEGGTFEHHHLSIARSQNIWGPYEPCAENPILTADGKPDEYIQHVGHGDLFQDESNQWWAVVLATRNEVTCRPLARETFLTKVEWPSGGWPSIHQPKMSFTAPNAAVHQHSQYFHHQTQNLSHTLDRVYIRDPQLSCYEVCSSPAKSDMLVLYPSLTDFMEASGTCTFIGERQRSLHSICVATIDLATIRGLSSQLKVGLAVYKDNIRHFAVYLDTERHVISFRGINTDSGITQEHPSSLTVGEKARYLHLKIVASSEKYTAWAALTIAEERTQWADIGTFNTTDLSAREMTGPIMGIYAHSQDKDDTNVGILFTEFAVQN